MSTIQEETHRKLELLDRYRTLRLEELVDDLRQQAAEEAERGRYPWRSEFRTRDEIVELYGKRRSWSRRYVIDLALLLALFALLLIAGSRLVNIAAP